MNWPLSPNIHLASDRIEAADAARQTRTARAILERFDEQPGVILADEVGMGKTYVALAVAVSVIEATKGQHPVVVMIPPSIREKWPREWDVFREKCMPHGTKIRATQESVAKGSEFLKLLDDPRSKRNHIIFLTHGALTSSLTDPYIKLALVRQAMSRRSSLTRQRAALPRWGRKLFGWDLRHAHVVEALLATHPSSWRRTIARVTGSEPDDDPVPEAVIEALREVDMTPLAQSLADIPLRTGSNVDARLGVVRREMQEALRELWADALKQLNIRLPLLILDEAHHLKNPWTRLAGLFANEEAKEDVEAIASGPLGNVFDRMLFMTATPFQLGHRELLEVLRRFEGTRWKSRSDREAFRTELVQLERALDASQTDALRLDRAWGRLTSGDLAELRADWWMEDPNSLPDVPRTVAAAIGDVRRRLATSQELLRPWVIRHARPDRDQRRRVMPGRSIVDDRVDGARGLEVGEAVALPFLIAARAQALVSSIALAEGSSARALFADGLSSSFETYRNTRLRSAGETIDSDAAPASEDGSDLVGRWYMSQLDKALPPRDEGIWGLHPKIAAVVERTIDLWRRGEKSVIFCFYIETGRALRNHISRALHEEFVRWGAERLALSAADEDAVLARLRLIGERFFDPKSPLRRTAESSIRDILHRSGITDPETLERAADVSMRFLRTRSFLLRHMDIAADDAAQAFEAALNVADASGFTLEQKIEHFGKFLMDRVEAEREELLQALESMRTGEIAASDLEIDPGERSRGREELVLPNVRLANGQVARETRRRLMLAFNTPFFPEILVASAVMSEGVDLHLNCRHTIHHDLDWNPSVLEQRTGRLDRLGSHAERSAMPIVVYEPFLEATQDEKQYRVVKDRERWFNVVMGEALQLDEATTDRLQSREPLPPELARSLSLRLEVLAP